ncbi:MAG: hypothetical protein OXN95_01325 [bacterium]|nr:hypothetical protein [bacterium]
MIELPKGHIRAGGRDEPIYPPGAKEPADPLHARFEPAYYAAAESAAARYSDRPFAARVYDGMLVLAEHIAGEMHQHGERWPEAVANACQALFLANRSFFASQEAMDSNAPPIALADEVAITLAALIRGEDIG